jgi:hypothetical protein
MAASSASWNTKWRRTCSSSAQAAASRHDALDRWLRHTDDDGKHLRHAADVRVERTTGDDEDPARAEWNVKGVVVGRRRLLERFGIAGANQQEPTLPWSCSGSPCRCAAVRPEAGQRFATRLASSCRP